MSEIESDANSFRIFSETDSFAFEGFLNPQLGRDIPDD
jgi:hypothetical protein